MTKKTNTTKTSDKQLVAKMADALTNSILDALADLHAQGKLESLLAEEKANHQSK
jgi:hypothetical protein